jgi:transposase
MKRTRRNHGATFKAQVALAAVKADNTLDNLTAQFRVHPSQVTKWKQRLGARAADVFGGTKAPSQEPDLKTLHEKIGQLAPENDFIDSPASTGGGIYAFEVRSSGLSSWIFNTRISHSQKSSVLQMCRNFSWRRN